MLTSSTPGYPARSTAADGAPAYGDAGRTRRLKSPSVSWYCSIRVRAWPLRSGGIVRLCRCGKRRVPRRITITIVPSKSGTPTNANSKKPMAPTPASAAASERMAFTGDPVSASSDPALPANASGMSSCDGGWPRRTDRTTTTGRRAGTEALRLMVAARTATSTMRRTRSCARPPPARAINNWPTLAVTPVASRAALTTNRDAMKAIVGSPRPPRAWRSVRRPVAQRASGVASATITTGNRSQTKSTTRAATIR